MVKYVISDTNTMINVMVLMVAVESVPILTRNEQDKEGRMELSVVGNEKMSLRKQ